jgi:hypothetical protein
MEQCFGHDFSRVRIHTGTEAALAARAVNARAYTLEPNVVFSEGQYSPDTAPGRSLLAHELTHVVQAKRGGVVARKAGVSESNDASEREAARNSMLVAAGDRVEVAAAPSAAIQRQPQQSSSPPPDANAPQMSPETQRQLVYAATVLSHVPAMPKDQEARLDQAIGGSELYRLITERNSKREELEELRQQCIGATPSEHPPEESDPRLELLGKEVVRLNQAIEGEMARLNMSVDETSLLNLVEQEFPTLWIERAKKIADVMLEQNRDVVNKEMARYQANVCSADIEGLRNADATLNKLTIELVAMTNESDKKQARIYELANEISAAHQDFGSGMQAELKGLKDLLSKIDAKKSELQETRNHYALEYPVLFQTDYKPGSLYQTSPEELESMTAKWMQQTLDNIAETQNNIASDKVKVWALPDVTALTSQSMGLAPESVLNRAVMKYIQGKISDEQALQKALMVLGMVAAVVATVATAGGALVVAAAAWGVGTGLTIGQLIADVQQYQAESAAEHVALDPLLADISVNDPEILPIVMDVIALGLDAVAVMGGLRAPSRAAMTAGDLDQFAAAARRSLPPAQAEALIEQTARRLGKAGVSRPPGPYTVLATKEGGDVFRDAEMIMKPVAEHPNLAALEASLRPGATLVSDESLRVGTDAVITFVRVTGPEGSSFTRALISYHPDRAVLQDLWHELNHLQDFQAGRIPAPFVIPAKDAAAFAELQAKSVQELLQVAKTLPKTAEITAEELTKAEVRKFVADERNHLRDLEELQYGARSPVETPEEFDRKLDYVQNSYNAIRDYRGMLGVLVERVPEADREAIRAYIRQYISEQFPELEAEYGRAASHTRRQDIDKNFWGFLRRRPADASPISPLAIVRAERDRSPGRPLEPAVRRPMEVRLGASFADVRVHADARSASLAEGIHAEAFTRGRDIYFGAGRYQPGTLEGRRLLAHELTHVIQHIKGPAPRTDTGETGSAHERETGGKAGAAAELLLFLERSLRAKPAGRDTDDPFEKEANRIADIVSRMFIPASGVDLAVPLMSKPVQPNCLDREKKDEEEQN